MHTLLHNSKRRVYPSRFTRGYVLRLRRVAQSPMLLRTRSIRSAALFSELSGPELIPTVEEWPREVLMECRHTLKARRGNPFETPDIPCRRSYNFGSHDLLRLRLHVLPCCRSTQRTWSLKTRNPQRDNRCGFSMQILVCQASTSPFGLVEWWGRCFATVTL
jgi:hypothetical protein